MRVPLSGLLALRERTKERVPFPPPPQTTGPSSTRGISRTVFVW